MKQHQESADSFAEWNGIMRLTDRPPSPVVHCLESNPWRGTVDWWRHFQKTSQYPIHLGHLEIVPRKRIRRSWYRK